MRPLDPLEAPLRTWRRAIRIHRSRVLSIGTGCNDTEMLTTRCCNKLDSVNAMGAPFTEHPRALGLELTLFDPALDQDRV
jgi:hypothetical protein